MQMRFPVQEMVVLKAVGDLVLGDHPVCFGHGVRSKIASCGIDHLFKGIAELVSGAEIVFGNLEVPLSGTQADRFDLQSGELRGEPWYAGELAKAGFNFLSVANNHSMQHGRQSFSDTVAALREHAICPVGVREDKKRDGFCLLRRKNIEFVFLAYSLRPEKYYRGVPGYCAGDLHSIVADLNAVAKPRRQIVVSLHWGEEYVHYPSTSQIDLAHALIDAGADLILGHHPHVLQGIEEYKNGLIAYSLGNFVADKWKRSHRESMVLECRFSENGIQGWKAIPVLINREYQPRAASPADGDRILHRLRWYSDFIRNREDTRLSPADYERMAEREYLRFRCSSYGYFVRNIFRYDPMIISASCKRFALRRLGGNQ